MDVDKVGKEFIQKAAMFKFIFYVQEKQQSVVLGFFDLVLPVLSSKKISGLLMNTNKLHKAPNRDFSISSRALYH